MKLCTRCRTNKDETEFSSSGKSLRGDCKSCHNKGVKQAYHAGGKNKKKLYYIENREDILRKIIAKKYNLSKDEFDAKLTSQDGRCGICTGVLKRPHVDHNHTTGAVRGLLCTYCNVGLDYFRNNVDRLLAAVSYLKAHK